LLEYTLTWRVQVNVRRSVDRHKGAVRRRYRRPLAGRNFRAVRACDRSMRYPARDHSHRDPHMALETRTVQHFSPSPELLQAAKQAASHAHSPNSRFHVGCAVRTATGKIYTGCNVENVSHPAGICAERAALAAAVVAEGPMPAVERILVYAEDASRLQTPCAPCGICRQVMAELAPRASVGFFLAGNEFFERSTAELLPFAFSVG
jgi:cytidine deaminase